VQQLAIHHRERLLTMTSVMSKTGEDGYGQPTPEAGALLIAPGPTDRESAVQRWVDGMYLWGSPEFTNEVLWRRDAEEAFDRSSDPAGVARQFFAIRAAGSWADELPGVTTPTLVIHGDKDTLIDVSGGRRTAALIPGATFVEIKGMGHDYPPELWDRWVSEVASFCLA
jgi:pimeloyl-ACP methyl ester carboxylesterase